MVQREGRGALHHPFMSGLGSRVNGDPMYSTRGRRRRTDPGGDADSRFGHDATELLPVSHPEERGSGTQEGSLV